MVRVCSGEVDEYNSGLQLALKTIFNVVGQGHYLFLTAAIFPEALLGWNKFFDFRYDPIVE